MNLAVRDIRHNAGRFAFTSVGIGLLLMIVMGMGGIYRGLIHEATLLVDRVGADLWIVQGGTRGPFAEVSRIPANLEDRARAVPGVAQARRFVSHTIQRVHQGKPLRMVVQGMSWPEDRGDWLTLVAGRPLRQGHYEMIADESLNLPLGTRIRLGKDFYQIVGLTRGMAPAATHSPFLPSAMRWRSSSTNREKPHGWIAPHAAPGSKPWILAVFSHFFWTVRSV
jgi:putative ABC transport system permease protein